MAHGHIFDARLKKNEKQEHIRANRSVAISVIPAHRIVERQPNFAIQQKYSALHCMQHMRFRLHSTESSIFFCSDYRAQTITAVPLAMVQQIMQVNFTEFK